MESKKSSEKDISTQSSTETKYLVDVITFTQAELFITINFVSICGVISLSGVVSNIINITVFFRQGFSNTVNISFFGLAISDLCCLITLLWMGVCLNPLIVTAGAPWLPTDFVYLTGAWPHNVCGRITSYITVYVTAERCLCIIIPMKVKELVTPARTTVIISLIYILNILTLVPEYATSYIDWAYIPFLNKTLLAISYRSGREKVTGLIFFMNSVTGVTSFVAVIIFTSILVVKLKKASIWRQKTTTGSSGQDAMSNRDKKTVKMIALIATVLIVCFTPGAVVSMVTFVEPEFDLRRGYMNSVVSMWSIAVVFQSVNSSVNIVFYYKMSSKYRQTFHSTFACMRSVSSPHITAADHPA